MQLLTSPHQWKEEYNAVRDISSLYSLLWGVKNTNLLLPVANTETEVFDQTGI